MADVLQCDCEVKGTQKPSYWWPLVYRVLESHHFHFVSPYGPHGMSNYHYFHHLTPNGDNTDEDASIFGTIQDLCNEISAEVGSVIATFWFQEDDGDYIDYDVSYIVGKDRRVTLGFLLPGGEIRDVASEKAQVRLQQFFSCCQDLFEVCQPYTGKIYWEDSSGDFTPWAMIGNTIKEVTLQTISDSDSIIYSEDQHIDQQRITNGKTLFFLNPAPVIRKHIEEKRWEYIPVLNNSRDEEE